MKVILSILATLVAFIPLELYLLAHFVLNPNGFWQNLVLLGVGTWILGTLQVVLFFLWIAVLVAIWIKKSR